MIGEHRYRRGNSWAVVFSSDPRFALQIAEQSAQHLLFEYGAADAPHGGRELAVPRSVDRAPGQRRRLDPRSGRTLVLERGESPRRRLQLLEEQSEEHTSELQSRLHL